LVEEGKRSKTWSEVERLGEATESDGDDSQMSYVANGTKGCTATTY